MESLFSTNTVVRQNNANPPHIADINPPAGALHQRRMENEAAFARETTEVGIVEPSEENIETLMVRFVFVFCYIDFAEFKFLNFFLFSESWF